MEMINNKHVFWQALVVTLVIFFGGIILGVWFEEGRVDKFRQFYYSSETNLFDIMLQQQVLEKGNFSCDLVVESGILLADKIYYEARELEKYDSANKISDEAFRLHRKYDLLRTFLWNSLIDKQEKCRRDFNVAVYLYQYKEPSVDTHAKQAAMSKVLLDLKKKYGDKVILIPIAYDSEIKSLDYLRIRYNLAEDRPYVIINQDKIITELNSVEELEKYLR